MELPKIKIKKIIIEYIFFLKFSIHFYIIELESKHIMGMSTTFWELYSSAKTSILFISLRMRTKKQRPITQAGRTTSSKN